MLLWCVACAGFELRKRQLPLHDGWGHHSTASPNRQQPFVQGGSPSSRNLSKTVFMSLLIQNALFGSFGSWCLVFFALGSLSPSPFHSPHSPLHCHKTSCTRMILGTRMTAKSGRCHFWTECKRLWPLGLGKFSLLSTPTPHTATSPTLPSKPPNLTLGSPPGHIQMTRSCYKSTVHMNITQYNLPEETCLCLWTTRNLLEKMVQKCPKSSEK